MVSKIKVGPYKGFYGIATYEGDYWYGRLLIESDVVTFVTRYINDIWQEFEYSVDDYLDFIQPSRGTEDKGKNGKSES